MRTTTLGFLSDLTKVSVHLKRYTHVFFICGSATSWFWYFACWCSLMIHMDHMPFVSSWNRKWFLCAWSAWMYVTKSHRRLVHSVLLIVFMNYFDGLWWYSVSWISYEMNVVPPQLATLIVMNILTQESGLTYCSATPECFFSIVQVLRRVVEKLSLKTCLLHLEYVIQCYVCLSKIYRSIG